MTVPRSDRRCHTHTEQVPFCQHGGVLGVFLEGVHAKPAAQKGDELPMGRKGDAKDRRGRVGHGHHSEDPGPTEA